MLRIFIIVLIVLAVVIIAIAGRFFFSNTPFSEKSKFLYIHTGHVSKNDVMKTIRNENLVNNPGSWSHIYYPLEHAPWHGATPTDLVFPDIIYEMADVETQAVPEPANPKPQYPPSMQRRQVEARFAVSFVVDTSGHIDTETIELPPVQHQEFATAVLNALAKWTFKPAVIAGHRVRERVKQPFFFRLK